MEPPQHFGTIGELFMWMVAVSFMALMGYIGNKASGKRATEVQTTPDVTVNNPDGTQETHKFTGDTAQIWGTVESMAAVQRVQADEIKSLGAQVRDQASSIQWLTELRTYDHQHINDLHSYIEKMQSDILKGRKFPPFDDLPTHVGPDGFTTSPPNSFKH